MNDSPPRVLLVGNFLSGPGGSRSVCEELALQLDAAGWSVLTTSHKPGRVARLLDMVRTVWKRRAEYEVAQVDVYSGPAFFWAEAVCWALQRAGKPYVLTLHGGNLPAFTRRWPGRVRRLLNSADAVTTPSRYMLGQLQRGCPSLQLLPNALSLSLYPFRLREAPRPQLVWLRAFHSIYNPVMAVEVLSALRTRHPEATLTMIGPDKDDGSFQATQRRAVELGVAGQVRFPGGIPKQMVPEWLDQGDIFLNTTRFESFGVSVMEAAAVGLPIVSTDVGELAFIWQNEVNAMLVPSGDVGAMASAVDKILKEPKVASRLSSKGREKAECFDWNVILPRWKTLLGETVVTGYTDVEM